MAADEQLEKWYFTKEQLANTPSQKCGYDADKELSCRQQAANFIQDMGQRLQVTQLCINTAIVYMHRFYMFHSFSRFHRTAIAAAALFLAAKVEEQPRKLEHVIKVAQICLHREQPPSDIKSEIYMEQAQELVVNENILLQTLGFDVAIDHPHTHVVRCCHLVRASKDLAQTSYFMASNSLHLTTMCLQYKPTVVACFCIHLACKWSDWEIAQSNEGKPWFWYVDKTVSQDLLEQLTEEFLVIFDKCPSRLKKKIMSLSSSQNQTILSAFGREDKKRNGEGSNPSMAGGSSSGLSVEDLKKKQEFQRHHADYKKHHLSHRSESHNMPSKSSCLFGPPQKTQPPAPGSSHISQSRLMGKPSLPSQPQQPPAPHHQQQSSQSDMAGTGKPEHLHHRPRRPDDKHVRNHESLRDTYKKYENKLTGAVLSDFSQTSSNGGSASTKSVVSNSNSSNSLSGVALSSASGFPVEPLPSSVQHGGLTEPVTVKNELVVAPAALAMSKMLQQSVAPHKQKTPPPVLQPPPPVKTERSIFSPEKTTPPSMECRTQLIPPLTGTKRKRSTSSESDMLLKPIKVEPPSHYDVVNQETLVPKEEKPPDQPAPVEQSQFPSTPPAMAELPNQPFQQLFLPQQSEQPSTLDEESYTKEQKKKKKKHREHKEKHKDKHKHKHRNRDPEPIVITIPKEKLTLPQQPEHGLKLKIPREKLTGLQTTTATPAATTVSTSVATGLKLKISQGKIKESRKREKTEDDRTATSPPQGLPSKYHRPNGTTLQVNKDIELLDCPDVSETGKSSFAVDALPTSSILLDDCGPSFDDFTGLSTPPGMSQDIMAMFNPDPTLLDELKPTAQAVINELNSSTSQTVEEVKSDILTPAPEPTPQCIPDHLPPPPSSQNVTVQQLISLEPPPMLPQLEQPLSYHRQTQPRQPYNKGGRGRQESSGSYRGRGRGGYQRNVGGGGGGGNVVSGLPLHNSGGGFRPQDVWNYSMQQMTGYVTHHHGRISTRPPHSQVPSRSHPHHQLHLRHPPPTMQSYPHLMAHHAPPPAYFTAPPLQSQHPMMMHQHHYTTGPPLPDEPPPLRPPPPPE